MDWAHQRITGYPQNVHDPTYRRVLLFATRRSSDLSYRASAPASY